MKIIFFGTPRFAAEILKYLVKKNIDIIATVTPTDKKRGRGKKLVFVKLKRLVFKIIYQFFNLKI